MPFLKSQFGSIFGKTLSTSRPAIHSNIPYASTPPPAYSAIPPRDAKPTASSSTVAPRSTAIEITYFSSLSTFDTVFLIDDSGSMSGRS